jgi:3-hydroxymyristoyl/3-hydroxydecanoyl-(acyl carrier protein) dehydratase
MDAHFRAFTFVDRIHTVQPGVYIQGRYAIPAGLDRFAPALVAEAVGQLAAWSAMAAWEFRLRPVAGLAAGLELLAPVHPGDRLELTAELETADSDAVAYSGVAEVNGTPVIRLRHAVGPMLPAEDFDDPQLLRQHYDLLRAEGVPPGAFTGIPRFALEPQGGEPGRTLRAQLRVPASAPFLDDHFPRRPVFPGSLLMNSSLELALRLAASLPCPTDTLAPGERDGAQVPVDGELPGSVNTPGGHEPAEDEGRARGRGRGGLRVTVHGEQHWALRRVTDVKLRAFARPGEVLQLEARLDRLAPGAASLRVETRADGRTIGSARLEFSPETRS